MTKINLNENKNQPEISKKNLEELGILKVISVVISEDGETQYRVVMDNGENKFILASELLK